MKCTPIVEFMHKYLDEEITQEEEKNLRSHMDSCNDCRLHFQELKKAVAMVKSTNHISAPDSFTIDVMNKLPKEKKSVQFRRWLQSHPMLSAAAVFAFLMLGSVFSIWTNDGQLSVSKQPNLVIQDDVVVVPEGEIVNGDVIVRNGDIRIQGEVRGNVVVINGEQYLASAGNVTGEMEEINAVFEWIWYNIKSGLSKLIPE